MTAKHSPETGFINYRTRSDKVAIEEFKSAVEFIRMKLGLGLIWEILIIYSIKFLKLSNLIWINKVLLLDWKGGLFSI